MLGCPAQTLHELRVEGNEAAFEKIFSDALFKTFVCKVSYYSCLTITDIIIIIYLNILL